MKRIDYEKAWGRVRRHLNRAKVDMANWDSTTETQIHICIDELLDKMTKILKQCTKKEDK